MKALLVKLLAAVPKTVLIVVAVFIVAFMLGYGIGLGVGNGMGDGTGDGNTAVESSAEVVEEQEEEEEEVEAENEEKTTEVGAETTRIIEVTIVGSDYFYENERIIFDDLIAVIAEAEAEGELVVKIVDDNASLNAYDALINKLEDMYVDYTE